MSSSTSSLVVDGDTNGAEAASRAAEDARLLELIDHYDAASAGPRNRVIGQISATVSRSANAAGESVMGDVIADA